MKSLTAIILTTALLVGTPACKLTEKYPVATRTIMSIGINMAVHKLLMQNPGLKPYIYTVGSILAEPMQEIAPAAVEKRFRDVVIAEVDDPFYRDSLLEIVDMIIEFYTEVYTVNQDTIERSKYIEMIQAFGRRIKYSSMLMSPQAVEFFYYNDNVIIEVR